MRAVGMIMETILRVENLKTHFFLSRGVARAVDGVTFSVKKGEVLGLVGESGSGKSITCMSIIRLLPAAARIVDGKIIFKGEDLIKQNPKNIRLIRGRKISMIMQDPSTSLNPLFTVENQVSEAIKVKYDHKGSKLRSEVIKWLDLLRLPAPEKRLRDYPHQLSGGMKQRVAGAIALSVMPDLIIADEPTTALDVTIQAQYLSEIKRLQRELALSFIFITHDLSVVSAVCDRVSVMYAGRIVEQSAKDDILQNHKHPYTSGLMASIPRMYEQVDKLQTIPGEPPSVLALPSGCSFNPRCPLVMPKCKRQTPQLIEISAGHQVSCWKYS